MPITEPSTTESPATTLPDDIHTCHQMIEHLLADMHGKDREILDLKCQLEALRRRIFGRRSEKIDPNQLALFEDLTRQLEAAEAEKTSGESESATGGTEAAPKASRNGKKTGHGRRALPADLPRERIEHHPPREERICPCCREPMTIFGEEITEELDYVPASFVVRQYVRPKYACKRCQEGVVVAELPARPIPKGIPGSGLLAQVLTSKYADHLPLNRQQGIFRRHGIELAASTMCDWVRDMADLLSPIVIEMKRQVLASHLINTDDTPVVVQGPSGRPCGKGYLWVYIGDGRQAIFEFTQTRSRAGPLGFLGDYEGYVQADAYGGYDVLFKPLDDGGASPRVEVGCWAHARRKFYDARLDDRRRCTEMLALIGRLYEVERDAKELDPDARCALRRERSAPVLNEIEAKLQAWSIELLPKNPVAQAVGYARAQWKALTRYIDDGRLPIDNNIAERALRMAAVGRKNWLFFGSDAGGHRAAVIYSLVAGCKLSRIDPFAYLRDVIARVCLPGFTRFAELTPAAWKAARQVSPEA
ncbi:MAG: IS66 family transposase [Rhodospirillales bacterium]